MKLWPTVRLWADALITGKELPLVQQVRQAAGRLGDTRLAELSRIGLDSAAISALLGNSSFQPLLKAVSAAPELGPLIKDGTFLKILQEAQRQSVVNLADLKTTEIPSAELRGAATRTQQLVRSVPGAAAMGAVDPAIVGLLSSDAFQQLCRSTFFESAPGKGEPDGA